MKTLFETPAHKHIRKLLDGDLKVQIKGELPETYEDLAKTGITIEEAALINYYS